MVSVLIQKQPVGGSAGPGQTWAARPPTVADAWPDLSPTRAVICTDPGRRAVTRPVAVTLAMLVSLLAHVTGLMDTVAPGALFAAALRVVVSPTTRVSIVGVTATEATAVSSGFGPVEESPLHASRTITSNRAQLRRR
jgi:hypothetical protein